MLRRVLKIASSTGWVCHFFGWLTVTDGLLDGRMPFVVGFGGRHGVSSTSLCGRVSLQLPQIRRCLNPKHAQRSYFERCPFPTQVACNLNLVLDTELPKLLGGRAFAVVTRAVISELRTLPKEFSQATAFAKRLPKIDTGGSSQAAAAGQSLLDVVSGGNPKRIMVLTLDNALREKLAAVPGVPLLRFARQALIMVPPAERAIPGEGAPPPGEARSGGPRSGEAGATNGASLSASEAGGSSGAGKSAGKSTRKSGSAGKSGGAGSEKRKRKEPNPLSVKKKIKGVVAPAAESAEQVRRRRRRRARSDEGAAGGEG